ncbi:SDR family NAD(P)-dependent oxidoreductase [Propioniciclava tarda]|uniref:SDR family NAD(P)-dependent oxidoreductase n=1 Tax=Propioniciclava tarda TaxID=433330 RepID=A0A4Q9KL77_PROTD|nr:SDR family NAD(P)-dependent oxidoreductase [Propioniciclava tarda]TBT94650.1 SDR family NAD(P)-dependent oxidoreductase [Propioniciclava tarda]SMO67128.1 NADP-dependent 3-hydroxy acid dehydrogenase YdfG [Propioniciclava tarda]
MTKTALVTGAGSGIGAASARRLSAEGYKVICAGRRFERLHDLAAEIDGVAVACDVTEPDDVAMLAEYVGDRLDLLVNNAGGAVGSEPLASADFDAWVTMFNTNVLGAGRVTSALLPALKAAAGTVIFITSTAADAAYEGGSGYNAAKAGERMLAGALRLELCGEQVRVCEIAPGMVHTEEFSLVRFHGDQAKADAVYAGVPDPLLADDIADAVAWVATRPAHVNIDRIVVRPVAQAANHKVFRTP